MPVEIRFAESLPPAAVSTLGGRRSVWVQGLVFVAVRTFGQFRTAGMLAGFLTFLRHKVHLRTQKAASDDSMAALVLFFAMIQYTIKLLSSLMNSDELLTFQVLYCGGSKYAVRYSLIHLPPLSMA